MLVLKLTHGSMNFRCCRCIILRAVHYLPLPYFLSAEPVASIFCSSRSSVKRDHCLWGNSVFIPSPHSVGHYAMITVVYLSVRPSVRPSVCLSVYPMPDHKSRMEGHRSWKLTGSPWHGSPVTQFRGRKVEEDNLGVAQLVYFTGTLMSN